MNRRLAALCARFLLQATVLACLFFSLRATAQTFEKLIPFETGRQPIGALIEGSDGSFYGITAAGGESDLGTVFRLQPDGQIVTLASFPTGGASRIAMTAAGEIYGMTAGSIIRVNPQGGAVRVRKLDPATVGTRARVGLLTGRDGNLYGMTHEGGASGKGSFFRFTPEGDVTVIADLASIQGTIEGPLVQDEHGDFYGVTSLSSSPGVAFRISLAGEISTVASLNIPGFGTPAGGLIRARGGELYGVSNHSASYDRWSLYRVDRSGYVSTIASFPQQISGGLQPDGELVAGPDGSLYGVTTDHSSAGGIFRIHPNNTFEALTAGFGMRLPQALVVSRTGDLYGVDRRAGAFWNGIIFRKAQGAPAEEVAAFRDDGVGITGILQKDGRFFGTTDPGYQTGNGTVFSVSPGDPAPTTLVRFSGTGPQGPRGGLVVGSDGALYGTARNGGRHYAGVLFRVTEAGECSILYEFFGSFIANPHGLIRASDGRMYGAVQSSGSSNAWSGGIFRATEAGSVSFVGALNGPSGSDPTRPPIEDADGLFFGVAPAGGEFHGGTFFRLELRDFSVTSLHSFQTATGAYPAGIVRAEDGMFYGVTRAGGEAGHGTVFRISRRGEHTVLAHFDGTNGSTPSGGLVFGPDGWLYGETTAGGVNDYGTIFSFDRDSGALITLHHFDGLHDGRPTGALIRGEDGDLFGATPSSIYQLAFPRVPLVDLASASGVTRTSALLSGAVNPQRAETSVAFEIFRADSLDSPVATFPNPSGSLPAGTEHVTFEATAADLQPGTVYRTRLVASNSVGATHGAFTEFTTLPNRVPIAAPDHATSSGDPIAVHVLANDQDLDGDGLAIASFGQGAFGAVTKEGQSLVYTPGPRFLGRDSFVYEVTDPFGGTNSARVEIDSAISLSAVVAESRWQVPGAGVMGSGIPPGARFKRFGVPSLTPSGGDGWLAKVQSTADTFTGIFEGSGTRMLLRTGDAVVDEHGDPVPGLAFRSFRDPVFAGAGKFAVIARVQGSRVSAAADEGLWAKAGESLQRLVMEGMSAPGTDGARFSRVHSVVISDSGHVAFAGSLERGGGGVTGRNDQGLWMASPKTDGSFEVSLVVRTGEEVPREAGGVLRVSKIRALVPGASTPGEGKADLRGSEIPLVVTFDNGSEAVGRVTADAAISWEVFSGEGALVGFEAAEVRSFGTPDSAGEGSGFATRVTLQEGPGGVDKKSNNAIFDSQMGVLAQSGTLAAGTEGLFQSFGDPVLGVAESNSQLLRYGAFVGRLQRVPGTVTGKNDTGVWFWSEKTGAMVELLVREGDEAPGTGGAEFAKFDSLAVLPGRGAVFTGTLRAPPRKAGAALQVTAANRRGLWAVDRTGAIVPLLRTGTETVVGEVRRVLSNFEVLTAVPGSFGQQRFFNDQQTLIVRAFFKDGTSAVMEVSVP